MKKILIRNGRLVDPAQNIDGEYDLLLMDGRVSQVAPKGKINATDVEIVEAQGLVVAPGFIDIHTHLREPGFEYKETVHSGTASAVSGGFTGVCCMANTDPVNDNASVTDYINKKVSDSGYCRVYPIGAVTKGLAGEELAAIAELKEAGCVAISDDGHTIKNTSLMRLAMSYARSFDLPVAVHSMDVNLGKDGQMNESLMSTRLGLKGIPNAAEDIIIARNIMLAELTGVHLHVAHLSTREGVRLVREAKARGIRVTCEVTPHHFSLTDEYLADYDTNYKMYPPLRASQDVQLIKDALKEGGVIDAIATDHAPHGVVDKQVEFDQALFGIIGFETALPLSLNLVREDCVDMSAMVELLTQGPAEVYGLPGGTLKEKSPADVVIFDPQKSWTLKREDIVSKSKNTPFIGKTLQGRVVKTFVGGELRYDLEKGPVNRT